jgi:chromosome segregation ATPase
MMNNHSFKAGMAKQMDDLDTKRHQLEVRMIEMEEDAAIDKKKITEKDAEIKKLLTKINGYEKGIADEHNLAIGNLDGMADLEAKLAFVTSERDELQHEIDHMT